jgi:hypothetical protein
MRQLRQRRCVRTGLRCLRLRLDVSQHELPELTHIRYFRHYLNIIILWSVYNHFELIPWVCFYSNVSLSH